MRNLIVSVEAYPDLKSNQNFLELQRQLAETEDRIAAGRRFYNANVRVYNTKVESVPTNIIANIFKFEKATYFEVNDPAVRQAPNVSFGEIAYRGDQPQGQRQQPAVSAAGAVGQPSDDLPNPQQYQPRSRSSSSTSRRSTSRSTRQHQPPQYQQPPQQGGYYTPPAAAGSGGYTPPQQGGYIPAEREPAPAGRLRPTERVPAPAGRRLRASADPVAPARRAGTSSQPGVVRLHDAVVPLVDLVGGLDVLGARVQLALLRHRPVGQLTGQRPGGLASGADRHALDSTAVTVTGSPSTAGAISWTAFDCAAPPVRITRSSESGLVRQGAAGRTRGSTAPPRSRRGRCWPGSKLARVEPDELAPSRPGSGGVRSPSR